MEIGVSSGAAALNGGRRLTSGRWEGKEEGRNGPAAATDSYLKAETKGGRGSSTWRGRGHGVSMRGTGSKRAGNENEDEEKEEEDDIVGFDSEDDASGHGEDEDTVRLRQERNHAERHSDPDLCLQQKGRLCDRASRRRPQLYEEGDPEKAYRRAVAI